MASSNVDGFIKSVGDSIAFTLARHSLGLPDILGKSWVLFSSSMSSSARRVERSWGSLAFSNPALRRTTWGPLMPSSLLGRFLRFPLIQKSTTCWSRVAKLSNSMSSSSKSSPSSGTCKITNADPSKWYCDWLPLVLFRCQKDNTLWILLPGRDRPETWDPTSVAFLVESK